MRNPQPALRPATGLLIKGFHGYTFTTKAQVTDDKKDHNVVPQLLRHFRFRQAFGFDRKWRRFREFEGWGSGRLAGLSRRRPQIRVPSLAQFISVIPDTRFLLTYLGLPNLDVRLIARNEKENG